MPAPRKPNTAAATAAVVRRGQENMAQKLRDGGWVVVPPEQQADLPELPEDARLVDWLAARGLPPHTTLAGLIAHERTSAALAVAFRLQDRAVLDRADLQESLEQMRRGVGRVVTTEDDPPAG